MKRDIKRKIAAREVRASLKRLGIPKNLNTRNIKRDLYENGEVDRFEDGFLNTFIGTYIMELGYVKDNPNNYYPKYHLPDGIELDLDDSIWEKV